MGLNHRPLPCQGHARRYGSFPAASFAVPVVTEAYRSVHRVTPSWSAEWYARRLPGTRDRGRCTSGRQRPRSRGSFGRHTCRGRSRWFGGRNLHRMHQSVITIRGRCRLDGWQRRALGTRSTRRADGERRSRHEETQDNRSAHAHSTLMKESARNTHAVSSPRWHFSTVRLSDRLPLSPTSTRKLSPKFGPLRQDASLGSCADSL